MENQFTNFIRVLQAFNKYSVDYILIGGVALILYGYQRLTRDVDIFVKMTSDNILNLRKALYFVFNDTSIDEITLDELQNYPVIRYGTPDGFYIDIVARLGEIFTYNDLEYETINYEDTQIRIGTPETLYKMKQGTVRERDTLDAMFLRELIKIRQAEGRNDSL